MSNKVNNTKLKAELKRLKEKDKNFYRHLYLLFRGVVLTK